MVRVRFIHHAGAYNPDEVAGFPPDAAARLVHLGVARPEPSETASAVEVALLSAEEAGLEEVKLGPARVPANADDPASRGQRIAMAHSVLDSTPLPSPGGFTVSEEKFVLETDQTPTREETATEKAATPPRRRATT
jgi:hypothetical protein